MLAFQQKSESLRVLVLTSSTGHGHNAAAAAFADWATYFFGSEVELRIEHLLENSSPVLAKAVDFYNFIQRKAPWFHHVYLNVIQPQELINPGTVSLGRKYYIQLLQEFQPHVLLSVHNFLNKGYFELGKKIIGQNLRCVTCCLEFQGGYGISRNWVNPHADLFCGRTEETVQAGIQMGMAPSRAMALGGLLPCRFYDPPMTEAEKINLLANQLGLQTDCFTLLLGTGGAGAQNHIHFLNNLLPLKNVVQVIALCGNNISTQEEVKAWHREHPDFNLCTLPFTNEIHKLLQVSSAIVARPGWGLPAEALHLGCPIIFNCLGGIMPQELLTVRYFMRRNMAVKIYRSSQLAPVIQKWLEQPKTYAQIRQKLLNERIKVDPKKVITQVLGTDCGLSGSKRMDSPAITLTL